MEHETLPLDTSQKLVPVFRRFSHDNLLKRCSRHITKNQNESCHNLVWTLPKSKIYWKEDNFTAVSLANCQFATFFQYHGLENLKVATRKKF